MDPLSAGIGAIGVLATLFGFWRMMAAVRSGAPRELVLGWMALMLAAAGVSTLVLRVL